MRIIVTENIFNQLIENMIDNQLQEVGYYGYKRRTLGGSGDYIGNRSGAESNYKDIEQTNDVNIIDKGRSSEKQREFWKNIGRKPNVDYYGGNQNHMWAHMRHLQSQELYGNRIRFISFDNGARIFYILDNDKPKYLLPNEPIGYDKL